MKLDIQLSKGVRDHFVTGSNYTSFQSLERFINYFFPENIEMNVTDNADIVVQAVFWSVEDTIHSDCKKKIILCVENCSGHPSWFYPHYTKFREYGDPDARIYFYNHIDRCVLTDRYIAIPIIYTQLDYYKRYSKSIGPTVMTAFADKKFCLLVPNNDRRAPTKCHIRSALGSLGTCDDINDHKHLIKNTSCYHSAELLNLLQQYKFVFVCENSTNNGYITEKIFNCYFSNIIPIYNGSQDIEYYFNKETFINLNNPNDDCAYERIRQLRDNEELYNAAIQQNKINNYDDENYKTKLESFIEGIIQE